DADGDGLTFTLLTGPEAMTSDAATGLLGWSPAAADLGSHAVAVQVSDGRGGVAEQRFVLSVIEPPPNRPPVFTSVPVVSARVNEDYSYQAAARDPDGDGLTFALVTGPAGLTIAADTGQVQWRPPAGQLGSFPVALQGSGGQGGTGGGRPAGFGRGGAARPPRRGSPPPRRGRGLGGWACRSSMTYRPRTPPATASPTGSTAPCRGWTWTPTAGASAGRRPMTKP